MLEFNSGNLRLAYIKGSRGKKDVFFLENRDIPQVGTFLEFSTAKTASDIMNANPSYVFEDSALGDLVRLMIDEAINEIPVLNRDKKVVGEANILEIITHYLKSEN